MQKSKSFTQYSGDSFSIRLKININGNILKHNLINYCGKKYRDNITQWVNDNKEHRIEYNKEYNIKNKEYNLKKSKEWRENNKKYISEWYINNKDKCNERSREWYVDNKDKCKELNDQWRKNNPDKIRIYSQKAYNKRRNYGFNPLNNWFEGSHFHHLHIDNPDDGIFMPGYIHDSIWHNPNNKESMDKINKLAFEYLENQKCD